ncbi:MAG: hypothetical protein V4614_15040 [Pseudomonadota bacterium]
MKTAVTQTSIDSYHAHKGNNFNGQFETILKVMKPGVLYSRRQIAHLAGMETSTVAARMHAMVADGTVEVSGRIKCPHTGVNVEAVKLPAVRIPTEQLELHAN